MQCGFAVLPADYPHSRAKHKDRLHLWMMTQPKQRGPWPVMLTMLAIVAAVAVLIAVLV